MYRALLAVLVFSSFALCVTTLILLGADSQAQLTPVEVEKSGAGKLAGAKDYSEQKMDISVSYPVRIATNSLGVFAALASLYFLYAKKYKGSNVMYAPLLIAAASFGMFLYNLVQLTSNIGIFERVDLNKTRVGQQQGGVFTLFSMNMDLASSGVGLATQLGTFFYLFNRRV
jgi:hypothetical protein